MATRYTENARLSLDGAIQDLIDEYESELGEHLDTIWGLQGKVSSLEADLKVAHDLLDELNKQLDGLKG